jgi:hypothetical protein
MVTGSFLLIPCYVLLIRSAFRDTTASIGSTVSEGVSQVMDSASSLTLQKARLLIPAGFLPFVERGA